MSSCEQSAVRYFRQRALNQFVRLRPGVSLGPVRRRLPSFHWPTIGPIPLPGLPQFTEKMHTLVYWASVLGVDDTRARMQRVTPRCGNRGSSGPLCQELSHPRIFLCYPLVASIPAHALPAFSKLVCENARVYTLAGLAAFVNLEEFSATRVIVGCRYVEWKGWGSLQDSLTREVRFRNCAGL